MKKAIGIAMVALAGSWWMLAVGAAVPADKPAKELTLDLGNKVTMKLVLIPAGKFMMGSPETEKDRETNETQHEVTISKPFYMGVYPVTQEQYGQMLTNDSSAFKGAQNPVEHTLWDDAVEFCKAMSKKTGKNVTLPTEAQWEYACRAGSTTRFYFGDDADYSKLGDYAWFDKNSDLKSHPVGQKKANDWGLYDMSGNVFQWCSDWYAAFDAKAQTDPTGPATGSLRILRGGNWSDGAANCRSAARRKSDPGFRYMTFGFRVVAEAK